jgi:hypothetical protein
MTIGGGEITAIVIVALLVLVVVAVAIARYTGRDIIIIRGPVEPDVGLEEALPPAAGAPPPPEALDAAEGFANRLASLNQRSEDMRKGGA